MTNKTRPLKRLKPLPDKILVDSKLSDKILIDSILKTARIEVKLC
jgi:hypothetical protein